MPPRQRKRHSSSTAVPRCARRCAAATWVVACLLAPLALPVVLGGCGGATQVRSAQSPLLGKTVPDFERKAIDGREVDTRAHRGEVVVVKFFAKHCKPCKRTLPEAQALHAALPDVMFIGVAEDEFAADTQELVGIHGLTFPVVHDVGNALAGRFRVTDMPVAFVVDASGTVRWVGTGNSGQSDLEAAIEAARE